MNTISIIGNLTADVEIKSTSTGIPVCSFTVAVRRPFAKDTTDFLRCTAWRAQAEVLGKYTRKGSKIGITGILTTSQYKDKNGENRTAYQINANAVDLLDKRPDSAEIPKPIDAENPDGWTTIGPDDLPF